MRTILHLFPVYLDLSFRITATSFSFFFKNSVCAVTDLALYPIGFVSWHAAYFVPSPVFSLACQCLPVTPDKISMSYVFVKNHTVWLPETSIVMDPILFTYLIGYTNPPPLLWPWHYVAPSLGARDAWKTASLDPVQLGPRPNQPPAGIPTAIGTLNQGLLLQAAQFQRWEVTRSIPTRDIGVMPRGIPSQNRTRAQRVSNRDQTRTQRISDKDRIPLQEISGKNWMNAWQSLRKEYCLFGEEVNSSVIDLKRGRDLATIQRSVDQRAPKLPSVSATTPCQ